MQHLLEKLIDNPVLKLAISTLGSLVVFLFGGFETILCSFVALLILDFITGILKAAKRKEISSYMGRKGGKKILGYAVIIIFANLVDQAGLSGIRSFAILWASITEAISIIENLDILGFPIPEPIRNKLLQTKKKKFGGML